MSNSDSDEGESAVQAVSQSEPVQPVERWRSFSEGEQVINCRMNWEYELYFVEQFKVQLKNDHLPLKAFVFVRLRQLLH